MKCAETPGCTGEIVDGYCDVCGVKPRPGSAETPTPAAAPASAALSTPAGTRGSLPATTMARRGTSRTSTASRGRGAGLVDIPPVPYRDPADAVMAEAVVDERRRFCSRCGEPVGRSRDGAPGRAEGFCSSCGAPFSFTPKLFAGDLVAGQYEVVGCLAHGGLGWVYLARDRNVSDRWVVLKGLLNTADDDAMAAALSERRFLAEVEHPNIVKIFNFVQHESSGYIVMEYVGGTSLREIMTERRKANGDTPDPLPVAHAIHYMLEILPALGYLHSSGLLFCDFKLDNVIQAQHSLKLIDLGGVVQIGDDTSPIYGTVGYQAPEIADHGPSVASDLFTVARTLALLCFDFRSYQTTFRYTLPPQDTVPVLSRYDSLYRFLARATAADPDDRFQSADEMIDQLFGVQREIVAAEEGRSVPAVSTLFTGDYRADPDRPDWGLLPAPMVSNDDPAAGFLATLSAAAEPAELIEHLRGAQQRTPEVELRLARELINAGDFDAAEQVLAEIEERDPWEWRVSWCRGLAELARGRPDRATASFKSVYGVVPGELAPKLALAVAAEQEGRPSDAAPLYEIVARTDPAYTTASFGLARCLLAVGARADALSAYQSVPESSSSYLDAQSAWIACLSEPDGAGAPTLEELQAAIARLQGLKLDPSRQAQLRIEILLAGLDVLAHDGLGADASARLGPFALDERELRFGIEGGYRELAHHATTAEERVRLVDRANAMRPRTLT
jgi:serine/threonine-protein kinase PknG